jgi:RecB family endonuclease NucS
MNKTYNKTIDKIMEEYFTVLKKDKRDTFDTADINYYFKKNYPKIKLTTIGYYLSRYTINDPNRNYYKPKNDGSDDILYKSSPKKYLLYNHGKNLLLPQKLRIRNTNKNNISKDNDLENEKALKNIIVNNLSLLEMDLKIYEEDGIVGIEFPAGGRFIDILAIDKNDDYVVIELKLRRAYDRVIGQLLRYKNWIKKYMAEGKKVRGIIIGKIITKDLLLACNGLPNIELFEYDIPIKFCKKEIEM